MVYLILAIVTSALVSIVMRLSGSSVKCNMGMLVMSYLTGTVLAACFMDFGSAALSHPQLPGALAMAGLNGFLYVAGFVLMQISIPKNGVVLTSTYMRLGLVVSILLSVLLFRELPTAFQVIGICLAVGAIILQGGKDGQRSGSRLMLILILLAGGIGDTWAKVFGSLCDSALSDWFLLCTFLCATLLCLGMMLYRKQRVGLWEAVFGIAIAFPNYFNSRFLLKALQTLPGILVYPMFCVGTLLLITAVGVSFFHEKLTRRQWVAMGIIVAAIVLLNL